MCTLSFLPRKHGYIAAMNRDELRSRPAALPPATQQAGGLFALYPSESGGGTWVGANSGGILLALLNWYAMETATLGKKSRSRGELIPYLLQETEPEKLERSLHNTDLSGVYPFRLFGFFPDGQQIREWRWNFRNLTMESHAWQRQHWFSSSRSDSQAAAERGAACAEAWKGDPTDASAWLRGLHASHFTEPGPFSVCVHREDAATVSYTEAEWNRGELQMDYLPGNPCQASQPLELQSLSNFAGRR